MLVTCPECGTIISEEANPCPKCGLPNAGRRSKEFNEYEVQKANKRIKEQKGLPGLRCHNCDWCGSLYSEPPTKIEIENLEVGYGVRYCFKCPKCGGLATRTIIYSPPQYD